MKRNAVENKITYDKNILISKDSFMNILKNIITNNCISIFETYIFFNETNIRAKTLKANSLKEVF